MCVFRRQNIFTVSLVFSGPRDQLYVVFFAEELGKISLKLRGGHHTTPALTLIGS